MLTEEDFTHLAKQIVDQCYPEERKYWQANQQVVLGQIFGAARPEVPGTTSEGDFKFAGELILALQVAGNAAALVSALVSIWAAIRNARSAQAIAAPGSENHLSLDSLKKLLEQGGVAAEKAAKIAEIVSKAT
jgi:hypothetical protein